MTKSVIRYDGVEYEVKEPTLDMWMKLNALGDFNDPVEFGIQIISLSTGLSIEQIKEKNWLEIQEVSQNLLNYFVTTQNEFHKSFVFSGKTYGFIDLPNLSFGEFIDIDSFLQKPEIEKKLELHLFMAFLYRELDENGKIEKYDASKVGERAELFRGLPYKYYQGSLRFFFHIEQVLRRNTTRYLYLLLKVKMMKLKETIRNRSVSFGRGMSHSMNSLMETLQRWNKYWSSR